MERDSYPIIFSLPPPPLENPRFPEISLCSDSSRGSPFPFPVYLCAMFPGTGDALGVVCHSLPPIFDYLFRDRGELILHIIGDYRGILIAFLGVVLGSLCLCVCNTPVFICFYIVFFGFGLV